MTGKLAHACFVCTALLATAPAGVPRADTPPPQPTTPAAASHDGVQVYIVRPENFAASLRAASIDLDGARVGALGNGGCLLTSAAPGDHFIVQSWPYWIGDSRGLRQKLTVRARWEAGHTYYYAMTVDASYRSGGIVQVETFEWSVTPIEPDSGASFVAGHKCKSV